MDKEDPHEVSQLLQQALKCMEETNRNTKQMGIATSYQEDPNRNIQYSQYDGIAGSFKGPSQKRPVVGLLGDSIIKGIRKNEFNYHVSHMSTL